MPATGPKADLAPRPSGEAASLEAGQATHGATTGAVPEVPLAEAMEDTINLVSMIRSSPARSTAWGRLPSRRTS